MGVVLEEGDWIWLNLKQTREQERDALWIEVGVESCCLFGSQKRKPGRDHLKLSCRVCWGAESFLVSSSRS